MSFSSSNQYSISINLPISSSTCFSLKGFLMKASAPSPMTPDLSSSRTLAVITIILMPAFDRSVLTMRRKSLPLIPGMTRSRRMRPGFHVSSIARASDPPAAWATGNPSGSSIRARISLFVSLSSTMRTRGGVPLAMPPILAPPPALSGRLSGQGGASIEKEKRLPCPTWLSRPIVPPRS